MSSNPMADRLKDLLMGILRHRIGRKRYAHTVTDGLRVGEGNAATVVPAPATNIATKLFVQTQPAGAVSGVAFTTQPVVCLRDDLNVNVLEAGIVVTAYLSSGTGTLNGTKQVATNSQGRAIFTNLSYTGTGSFTVSFACIHSYVHTIWSDDVEADRLSSYFDYDLAGGAFSRALVDGSMQWRSQMVAGSQSEWGNLKIGFGRIPTGSYMTSVYAPTTDFGKVSVECNMYHSVNSLTDDQDKFMRLLVVADDLFSEAAKSHCWSNGTTHLQLDPTSTVVNDVVTGVGPNDYAHQTYLGAVDGTTIVFGGATNPATLSRRYRHEMTLNTPGFADGSNRLYINEVLEIEGLNYNFVGRWTGYGINSARWENYRELGIGKSNNRYMDNLLVTGQARSVIAANALTATAGGGGGTAWVETDWSEFANAAAIQSSPLFQASGSHWQDTIWNATDGMSLDLTEGYGTSDRCLKTNFPTGAYDTDGRTLNLWLPSSVTEHWSEFWCKFSTSFDSNGSNANNPDYKFIFWALQPNDGRNEIKVGNGGPMDELACVAHQWDDTQFITAANNLNSGIWHRYRVHNKVTGGAGGIFSVEFWDGTNAPILLSQTPNIAKTSMNYIVLGANRNKVALVPMWLKWGKITIYNSDPGWGF